MATLEGKSVVVTGGAGFIGSHLVEAIIARRPFRLAALDDFFLGNRDNLRAAAALFPGLEIVEQIHV